MADRHLDGLINMPDFQQRFAALWRGRVTRLDLANDRVWVTVPGLTPGFEYGPCDIRGLGLGTATGSTDAHTHAVSSVIAAGNSVLLTFAGGNPQDPVIIRRLQED